MATQNLTRLGGMHKKRDISVFTTVLDIADATVLDITTSADIYELFTLPDNGYVTKAEIFILIANDAATSAVADLGFAGDDTLIDGANLKAVADTVEDAGTNAVVPQLAATGGIVTLLPTYVGTPTVGKFLVNIEYTEIDKTDGELTVFSTTV